MTATDALSVQPAARPEPSAAKAAAPNEKGKSFADMLGAETTKTTEAVDEPKDPASSDEVSSDAMIIAQPTQPAPPPVTPVMASPAAVLAGLDPNAGAAEETSTTPAATDGVKPAVIPEIAIDTPASTPAPATANVKADPAVGAGTVPAALVEQVVVAQQVATVTQPATATPAKPAAKKETKTEIADPATDTTETASLGATVEATKDNTTTNTTPVQPTVAATAMSVPIATPEQAALPASAPGAERATAAVEGASSSTTKTDTANAKAATAVADGNSRASATKAAQVAAAATDAAPDLKADAVASGITSTSATDTLAATRTSGTEASKAAQASPATQAAPAATIQVYSRMIERFDGRAQRYEIRLDPAELGRVDVRIEVGADKKVHAVLAAHDSAALTDLMRGQRALETSLRQAGIDVADGGIKFELSSDTGRNLSNGASQGETNKSGNGSSNVWRNFSTVDVPVDANAAAAARSWRSSRLDLVA